MFQQTQTLFARGVATDTVIYHIEGNQFPIQTLVADGCREGQQLWRNLWILHTDQHSLVVLADGDVVAQMGLLLDDDLLGGMLRHQRTDHTGEEDHHHHAVKHDIIHQIDTRCHL